jgi:hypothetical protein
LSRHAQLLPVVGGYCCRLAVHQLVVLADQVQQRLMIGDDVKPEKLLLLAAVERQDLVGLRVPGQLRESLRVNT